MKNKEKYTNEITDLACKNTPFAINKRTGEIMSCHNCPCRDCIFDSAPICCEAKAKWAEEEYKEPLSVKSVGEEFFKMCTNTLCDECKYASYQRHSCVVKWMFDNYNITEKEKKNENSI